jgi:hypothetical protein
MDQIIEALNDLLLLEQEMQDELEEIQRFIDLVESNSQAK